ncbi:adenylyltransferase/cytidyltransferase family protein [Ramlibacter sp. MAHUQ-53]|uniref:adenylyltransferase/cytidyltransferase family protein n=1 Tax=unclassified Ramlibacter TaxID=2617605 RepID=UPI00362BE522
MTTVITYGTFDLFHVGHVRLLERLRALGDRLIVAVSTDEFNALKGKKAAVGFADRCEILRAVRHVDLVIPECNWGQKRSDIVNYGVDIFGMGDDWAGRFDDLRSLCEVVYLPRTRGISTTDLKREVAAARG